MIDLESDFIIGLTTYLDREKISPGMIADAAIRLKSINYMLGRGSFVEVIGDYKEEDLHYLMDKLMDWIYKTYGVNSRDYIDLLMCETLWASNTPGVFYKIYDPVEDNSSDKRFMYKEMGVILV